MVGLSRLKAVHINDSMNPPGSRKDRHALIGEGTIGTEAIVRIITHPALAGLPFLPSVYSEVLCGRWIPGHVRF